MPMDVLYTCVLRIYHTDFVGVADFAEKRLKLAEILYYKVLENVMVQEVKRLPGKDMSVGSSL